MYIPEHFKMQELVPPDVFADRGELSITLLDERVLRTLDQLRKSFGICVVNNWHTVGGNYCESGLRTPYSKNYSATSQHTFGRAMDCKFKNHTAAEVRKEVISNRILYPWITFMEDEVTWFHFDVRNANRIELWSPSKKTITLV